MSIKDRASIHNFHIPVMGVAYTIDTPIRVAHLGIDSVISIVDDDLLAILTEFYAEKFQKPYEKISKKIDDFRALRVTQYLNLLDNLVKEKFTSFTADLLKKRENMDAFLDLLPSNSEFAQRVSKVLESGKSNFSELQHLVRQYLRPGSIDVNIMTKVDKDNFKNGVQLPVEYNDAHASLRGFAQSNLDASVVFSAGMNPRLYSYAQTFDDFYPNANGDIRKKIILKVSDYRSAVIQGSFLAKKGLWVSEYRIESGLNCGGHAFATEGLLLGPILEEFKEQKAALKASAYALYIKALNDNGRTIPIRPLDIKVSVQGGVGNAEEHGALINYYEVDSVGWGTPFLLVPEATSVDEETRKLLAECTEDDLYLSNISPLGVPFNTIKGTSNDFYKSDRIMNGNAGSACPKKFLSLNKELGEEGTCTASKKYQDWKLHELDFMRSALSVEEYNARFQEITEKACLCVGLSNASLLDHNLPIKGQKQGVVICPGPNMAYFTKIVTLTEMVQHIYGKKSLVLRSNRPNFLIKELVLYVNHYKSLLLTGDNWDSVPFKRKMDKFKSNLLEGIAYYISLFSDTNVFKTNTTKNLKMLEEIRATLRGM